MAKADFRAEKNKPHNKKLRKKDIKGEQSYTSNTHVQRIQTMELQTNKQTNINVRALRLPTGHNCPVQSLWGPIPPACCPGGPISAPQALPEPCPRCIHAQPHFFPTCGLSFLARHQTWLIPSCVMISRKLSEPAGATSTAHPACGQGMVPQQPGHHLPCLPLGHPHSAAPLTPFSENTYN